MKVKESSLAKYFFGTRKLAYYARSTNSGKFLGCGMQKARHRAQSTIETMFKTDRCVDDFMHLVAVDLALQSS